MSQDQGPLMWALVLASAYLQLYKNTDKSVSRLKWVSNSTNNDKEGFAIIYKRYSYHLKALGARINNDIK